MAYSSHSILLQIVVQNITFAISNQNREKMIYVLFIRQQIRQLDQRIINMFIVIMSHLLTVSIILYQILQFHIQNSCLNLVQTAIAASIFEHILLL